MPVEPDRIAHPAATATGMWSNGGLRWLICALLFFATTINYVDRVTMSVLESALQKDIGWTSSQWGYINASFLLTYAFGSLFAGWMMDKLGVRIGFSIALISWSLITAVHALAHNVFQFVLVRFALGIGESGNFPGAIKATSEWFPKKDRALATGVFNSGSNVGQILAAALVPLLALNFGWQAAFLATAFVGLLWVFFWWPIYRRPREHPWISQTELTYIESDPPDRMEKIPWRQLLPYRQTWAFAIGKFLTDSIWWFYVFWFPKFMNSQFGMDIKTIGKPMVTVYVLATFGSIIGGWESSWLLARGWSTNAARKTAMLTCALCVLPVIAAPRVANPWIAVLLIGLATAAHQGFSCNLFTLTSDMFPRRAVGSIVGLGTFTGGMGGFILQVSAGIIIEWTHNYLAIFALAGSSYIVAVLIIQLLVPRIEMIDL
ncbi:MAG TPA: MFS transporter [Pirellulales bacterium]|jgi:ACS family hexuronate transporter-like MFS transporter|nr:MFS transporter [Pirellulales bacterium]